MIGPFSGNSKSSRIAMGTSPNDFPLNKMPMTQDFCLKPAYLRALQYFKMVRLRQDNLAEKGRQGQAKMPHLAAAHTKVL